MKNYFRNNQIFARLAINIKKHLNCLEFWEIIRIFAKKMNELCKYYSLMLR